jgi:hypothetical protein
MKWIAFISRSANFLWPHYPLKGSKETHANKSFLVASNIDSFFLRFFYYSEFCYYLICLYISYALYIVCSLSFPSFYFFLFSCIYLLIYLLIAMETSFHPSHFRNSHPACNVHFSILNPSPSRLYSWDRK